MERTPLSAANVDRAKDFLRFLNKSVTPYHAVAACEEMLHAADFKPLYEWNKFPEIRPFDRYYIKKNESSVFAFAVGGAYTPGKGGFSAVMAHTDSPCLRVKPVSKLTTEKYLQVGVSTYGGGLWRTWFDRDLSIAGQVTYVRDGTIFHKLVDLGRDRPLLHIPNLAIHLETNRDNFAFNKETHLRPVLAHCATSPKGAAAAGNDVDGKGDAMETEKCDGNQADSPLLEDWLKGAAACSITGDHHAELLEAIAAAAGCAPGEFCDLDLYLYDCQPAVLSGLRGEFISGARLDNLVGTFTAMSALVASVQGTGGATELAADPNIRLVGCFDHEEVGSESAKGANSAFTEWLLRRLSVDPQQGGDSTAFERAVGRSLVVSADQAHAVHPNYADKHESAHKPELHGGMVVKINVNQRYATSCLTHTVFKVIADLAGVPLQKFVVRNDSLCGSTVGPILAAKLGIQTIDVGCPQLAMHSIRELADANSIVQAIALFTKYFEQLPAVLRSVKKAE